MKTRFLILSLLVISCFTGATVFGLAGLTETIGQGEVDWEKGLITVTGVGAPPENASEATAPLLARRAAMLDAYRNAIEVINGVRIRSGSVMKDYTIASDEVSSIVEGFVKGGQFEEPTYDSKGRCEIVLHLPIGGHTGLTSVIYTSVQENAAPAQSDPAAQVPYTGLIIDARNLGIRPALYPQVFDADGFLVYGQTMVNVSDPNFSTIAAYSKTLENAKTLARIGDNPLIIKAIGAVKAASGEPTDIIIGSEDSKVFHETVTRNEIVSKAAVAIIIN